MSRFRQSRVALLIDLALLPLSTVGAILRAGVPAVCREVRNYPKYFANNWKGASWL